jgi:serine/threonine protein kinase
VAGKDPSVVTNVKTVGIAPPASDSGVLPPGHTFGRYVIQKVLGEGGMGIVYEAFDPSLNRKLAVKVLRVDKSGTQNEMDTQSSKERLLREAQAMAQIGHPNLVAVYDVGTYGDKVFIAMEFVNGETLRDWGKRKFSKDWREILDAYMQGAAGLSAAHQMKLVHRDFKPENVMIGVEDSRVRVMDFGLVRHVGNADDTLRFNTKPLTQTGMIMGTPAYMAPEQFLGEPADHRTDQFSFCVGLYEALYGYRPFAGKNATKLARNVLSGTIALPPRKCPVPGHVLTALLKGLQVDPADRHDSMEVLVDALIQPDNRPGRPWLLYVTTGLAAAALGALYLASNDVLSEQEPYVAVEPEPEPPLPPKDPPREGTFAEGTVKAMLEANAANLARCSEIASTLGDKKTEVTLTFLIDKTGKTEKVEAPDLDLILLLCFERYAGEWQWPEPTGPAKLTVTIPLARRPAVPPPKRRAR